MNAALMSVDSADHLLDDTLILADRWPAAGNRAFPCQLTREWTARTNRWFTETLATPS
jgi:hypothetical protein